MTLKQKRAISYSITRRDDEARQLVIRKLGLEEAFRRSKYSSRGWFLKSLGLNVTHVYFNISPSSPFANNTEALELSVSWGGVKR